MKPEWTITESGPMGIFPIRAWKDSPDGQYEIHIVKRPNYCDRGDWLIHVEGNGTHDLDDCDGFPRYFIGTQEEVIVQMEKWLNRRDAYLRYVLTT